MNILTFDIEEWYLDKHYFGATESQNARYDRCLDEVLALLDRHSVKATFFCVGGMGREFPEVVRRIKTRGHEIGCHSDRHEWLNKMSREEVVEDTRRAVDSLEQCLGEKVVSYRAPAFSIGAENAWVFDVLADCGLQCDASIFPAARDFGGFPGFGHNTPVRIDAGGRLLVEFPIRTVSLAGHELAVTGGGYFRFFPQWYVKSVMRHGSYNMTYFHIDDLLTEKGQMKTREEYESYFKEPGTLKNRCVRYLKSNIRKSHMMPRLDDLLSSFQFVNIAQAMAMLKKNPLDTVVL